MSINFRDQILHAMEVRGVNQTWLCEQTGLSTSSVSRLLTGDGRTGSIRAWTELAEALDGEWRLMRKRER